MSARKTERLLNLVICLLATRRYLAADQIRRTVAGYEDLGDEAFKRKFERDKEDLRDLGIPLETGTDSTFDDEPGYRIRRDDYSLPEITLTPAELAVLAVAARTWRHASLGAPASEALLKLRAAGVDIDEGTPAAIETRVATSEPAFEALWQAASDRRAVTFDYRAAGATRHVEPWGLVSWHGRWYLVGHDRDRSDTRVFRLSRIVGQPKPQGGDEQVQVPEGTDIRAILLSSVEDEPARLAATLLIREGSALAIRRRALSVRSQGDGWDVVELAVPSAERLADEVIGFGADVVVVEPAQARKDVLQRLHELVSGS